MYRQVSIFLRLLGSYVSGYAEISTLKSNTAMDTKNRIKFRAKIIEVDHLFQKPLDFTMHLKKQLT